MILVVQHVDIEGAGAMGTFFNDTDWDVKVLDIYNSCYTPCRSCVSFPEDTTGLDAVIVLGGPMNVYEEEKYPFLKDELVFIQKLLEKKIPLLGICLGGQLIARASGAAVRKAPEEEIGWAEVMLTEEGKNDPFFEGVGDCLTVFQWHEDTFDIPENAVLLATGRSCRNQAFRAGERAYGLQFHLEMTGEMIRSWSEAYLKKDDTSFPAAAHEMLDGYSRKRDSYGHTVKKICFNFSRIIAGMVSVDRSS